jgi:hypothetical protein
MKKFVFGKTSKKIFRLSTNCTCGRPAFLCALDTHGSDDAANHDLLGVFCRDCAAQGIRELPRCSWLHIVVASRSGQRLRPLIRRNYKVYSLNERENRADIVIIDGSNQFLCGQRLTTRLDVIPQNSRTIDATFEVGGTPLEIDLFEHSGSK